MSMCHMCHTGTGAFRSQKTASPLTPQSRSDKSSVSFLMGVPGTKVWSSGRAGVIDHGAISPALTYSLKKEIILLTRQYHEN